jgi:hypothetical protein
MVFTHDAAARNTRLMALEPPAGFLGQESTYRGKRVFMTFPPFHVSGSATSKFETYAYKKL